MPRINFDKDQLAILFRERFCEHYTYHSGFSLGSGRPSGLEHLSPAARLATVAGVEAVRVEVTNKYEKTLDQKQRDLDIALIDLDSTKEELERRKSYMADTREEIGCPPEQSVTSFVSELKKKLEEREAYQRGAVHPDTRTLEMVRQALGAEPLYIIKKAEELVRENKELKKKLSEAQDSNFGVLRRTLGCAANETVMMKATELLQERHDIYEEVKTLRDENARVREWLQESKKAKRKNIDARSRGFRVNEDRISNILRQVPHQPSVKEWYRVAASSIANELSAPMPF